ncbi:MFS monocarboxylate transporter-like protein [Cucurbitaria berberidis CBS 394.84]|uniref:MFS monocarboxylate transporter-like protein n=1 Tax=Cucurbitaria berberidis CBS 394.84 TaxID=1168544 RepID=A0A9P4GIP6_9PLEO|nr:MFS monocarboxylate transporter-like protein [Cucurbitaria berberidis CBS 394.84]KAF1846362.1 MFS monocarboxylate transporter-like protein [Cucurbitaria berberidis CBS 394.84]
MEILEPPTSVHEAYPERGLKAYSVVFGAWLILFPASGILNSTGIFQAWLFQNQLQGYSESEVSWIFSTFAFLFFFGGLFVGPIFDNYGSKTLLPAGAAGLSISLVATSFCKSYYQFILAFGCLGGGASSILWTTSIATLGHWFEQNRGLATGLATTAGGFGGVGYPVIFARLTSRIGFAWTMRCFALLSTFCFLLGVLLLDTRLPRSSRGALALNWQGFRDVRFVLTMSAIFILDWAVLIPPAYITIYAASVNLHSISQHILAILNAASIFGRGLPGPVADRLGRFNVMIACSTMCTISILGLWLNIGSSIPGLVAFAVVYGFFSGSAYSLTPVCVAQLCKTEDYASRYGTAYGIVSFATLAGVPLSGTILSAGRGDNYSPLILFCGATYATSTLIFIMARGVSKGWRLRTKF